MPSAEDWKLDPPSSLREVIEDELLAATDEQIKRGESVGAITEERIDKLMLAVYAKIEKEALATYHSNEPWALKQWAFSNILKDEVVNEVTAEIAHNLVSPVIEWQEQQPFDPIDYFSKQLIRKAETTKKGYMLTASRFVGMVGRKQHYTDEDVLKYIQFIDKHYDNNNTYAQECIRLLQFLRRLPGADKRRDLPIDIPKVPKRKKYVHAFTLEELEELCWACLIDNIHYRMVVRLIASTIYGRRVGELTNFEVHLDGANSTVLFPTRKGGEQVAHPLPQSLVPLFSVPMDTITGHCLNRWLKQVCKKAEIKLPYRGGFHSIRRTVATTVKHCLKSDIDTHKFMRWAEPRELGILAQYDQTRYEDVDRQVLEVHPVVKMWEEITPYLLKMNRSYKGVFYNNAY